MDERVARRGDFIFCQVNAVDDLPNDPQVQANQYVIDFAHPRFGATQVMGIPVRLRETPRQRATSGPGVRRAHRGDSHRPARLLVGTDRCVKERDVI
jgi:crotonobetainyl-CoA:carnitine CoA-transferase CaiB-like acyl-CoA transferase